MKKWILASLASICVLCVMAHYFLPQDHLAVRKFEEDATKRMKAVVASGLSDFHGHMPDKYPADFKLLHPELRATFGSIEIPPYHNRSDAVASGRSREETITDAGGWAHVFDPTEKESPIVFVNCTHTDSAGKVWTSY